MGEQVFKSVGIDIGTSTTKLIFSQFVIENQAPSGLMGDFQICGKTVLYKSPIYFTPLLADGSIDFEQLKKILSYEYQNNKLSQTDIATGAVIITGESARKHNSAEVVSHLSEFAGDFVVAIAGPDIEAIFAGYGSGAAEIAQKTGKNVININIGGGTTNIVIFKEDQVYEAFALDLGGRLIRYNSQHQIEYVSSRLGFILNELKLTLNIHEILTPEIARKITDRMANYIYSLCLNGSLQDIPFQLLLEHDPKELKNIDRIDCICFSGGVAEFIYDFMDFSHNESTSVRNECRSDIYYDKFGDIGIYLAESLAKLFSQQLNNIITIPNEIIRATVVGAGNNSISLSGSTIFIEQFPFPAKNIPVVPLILDYNLDINKMMVNLNKTINFLIQRYNAPQIAFWLKGVRNPSYEFVKHLAIEFVSALDDLFKENDPIIILLEHDFAKALGQSIQIRFKNPHPLIVLDRVRMNYGNFIDIGKPLMGVVPIIIKTMIFNSAPLTKK
jgi:ethanolamine utilization protein EutA